MAYRCDKCGNEFESKVSERCINPDPDGYDMEHDVSPCCHAGYVEL